MHRERFELALRQVSAADGMVFEQLASAFAVVEFGQLRTVASIRGDGGKDAFLYSPSDDSLIVFQYSVTKDAAAKVIKTAARLRETTPEARELIYVTSQQIGISLDETRRRLRKEFKLSLDVWDRNWFLDHVNLHPQAEAAAESLARLKVDTLLAESNVASSGAPSLSSSEEREAAFFIALQYEDEDRRKGLTKLCYDSLVRAALRGTHQASRVARVEIYRRVSRMVPGIDVHAGVDSSLQRLSKTALRHTKRVDEFCLAYDEATRMREKIVAATLIYEKYDDEILREISNISLSLSSDRKLSDEAPTVLEVVKSIIDRLMFDRGQSFAKSLSSQEIIDVEHHDIEKLLETILGKLDTKLSISARKVAVAAVKSILTSPESATLTYLRGCADSYLLLSLLRGTPDVQKTVVKLFSGGQIWLDTNMLLPVIAEELTEPEARQFTNLFQTARRCGLSLKVTAGVVEELSMHMRRSLAYERTSAQGITWRGDVPFLYAAHALAGKLGKGFGSWIENFRGPDQPEEDVAEYLAEVHGIQVQNLKDHADRASVEMRGAVQEIWFEARSRRSNKFDPSTVRLLVDHDVECYLGVIQKRRQETSSSLGYNSWWVTLDATAFRANRLLSARVVGPIPSSPVMSPDFLLSYLEVGPLRSQLNRDHSNHLPLMLDISFLEGVSPEMLSIVREVAAEHKDQPQRVIRRKIRDTMNRLKSQAGVLSDGGVAYVEQEVLASIEASARKDS